MVAYKTNKPASQCTYWRQASCLILSLILLASTSGCQRMSTPWAGTPYSPPSIDPQKGQRLYSPIPEILPGQFAEKTDTVAGDREIERTLFGRVDENDSASGNSGTTSKPSNKLPPLKWKDSPDIENALRL